jgi:hypothetical protein
MAVSEAGGASVRTVVLLTPEEVDAAAKHSVEYRSPMEWEEARWSGKRRATLEDSAVGSPTLLGKPTIRPVGVESVDQHDEAIQRRQGVVEQGGVGRQDNGEPDRQQGRAPARHLGGHGGGRYDQQGGGAEKRWHR